MHMIRTEKFLLSQNSILGCQEETGFVPEISALSPEHIDRNSGQSRTSGRAMSNPDNDARIDAILYILIYLDILVMHASQI